MKVFNVGHDESMGLRSGLISVAIGLAVLTGTPIAGVLIQGRGAQAFLPAQIFVGVSFVMAAFSFMAARWFRIRWRPERL